jgi:hypothetical protein
MSRLSEQPAPHSHPRHFRTARAQSFIELALVLPVLFIILLGVVEVAIFIGRYLDALELTRIAARFASKEERFTNSYYSEIKKIFEPPDVGLNEFLSLNPATDDVIISYFMIYKEGSNTRYLMYPNPSGWALSNHDHPDHDRDNIYHDNWKRNCQGEEVRTEPYFTIDRVRQTVETDSSQYNRGFVAVEIYYCHQQALGIPIISQFIPNPIQIHAYTILSFPPLQESEFRTPIPTDGP